MSNTLPHAAIHFFLVVIDSFRLTFFRFFCFVVKFDTAKLPAILNALETENNGQRLVLEVAVGHHE